MPFRTIAGALAFLPGPIAWATLGPVLLSVNNRSVDQQLAAQVVEQALFNFTHALGVAECDSCRLNTKGNAALFAQLFLYCQSRSPSDIVPTAWPTHRRLLRPRDGLPPWALAGFFHARPRSTCNRAGSRLSRSFQLSHCQMSTVILPLVRRNTSQAWVWAGRNDRLAPTAPLSRAEVPAARPARAFLSWLRGHCFQVYSLRPLRLARKVHKKPRKF